MPQSFITPATMDRIADAIGDHCKQFEGVRLAPKGARTRVGTLLYRLHAAGAGKAPLPYRWKTPAYATRARAQAEQYLAISVYLERTDGLPGETLARARLSLDLLSARLARALLCQTSVLFDIPAEFQDR